VQQSIYAAITGLRDLNGVMGSSH